MARQCLFCSNPANTGEHLFSDWILEELKSTEPIRISIGSRPPVWKDGVEIIVNCVCGDCNSTWMSDLENENKSHMLPMMHSKRVELDPAQQKLLARWAILKSVVMEATNRKREVFYGVGERKGLMPPSPSLPNSTLVWIGRFSRKGFHAGGTDLWGKVDNVSRGFHGCVTTIVVGHLVIQVLTVHVLPRFRNHIVRPQCKPGAWDVKLINLWPTQGPLRWPPPVTFTQLGSDSIGKLFVRFSLGVNVN
jgi:hypothetical protein